MPNELSSRLHHLEVMLQQLNTDLERVRIQTFPLFCFFLFCFFFLARRGHIFERPPRAHACALLCVWTTKEKQDKVVLLAEMANLRENNQRLQEESLTTTEQLRKFSRLFSNLDKAESHPEAHSHSLTHGADCKPE